MRSETTNDEFSKLVLRQRVDFTEASRNRDYVDRGVTATDANHAIRGYLKGATVESFEKGDPGNAVGCITVLEWQATAALATDCPQHGVVILFEVFNADIAPDASRHARVDAAHFDYAIDFVI